MSKKYKDGKIDKVINKLTVLIVLFNLYRYV